METTIKENEDKLKIKEELYHNAQIELAATNTKFLNERAQVETLQSKLTDREKALLKEKKENERVEKVSQSPFDHYCIA